MSITGERLSESVVLEAVRQRPRAIWHCSFSFMMLGVRASADSVFTSEWKSGRPDRELWPLRLTRRTCRLSTLSIRPNDERRLGEVTAYWFSDNAGEAFKTYCVKHSMRGQLKTVALA